MGMTIGLGVGVSFGTGAPAAGVPAIDPATLNLSGFFRDWAGAISGIWEGTASAGTSGDNDLTNLAASPAEGSLNGHGYAIFNGTTNALYIASSLTLLATDGYTISILARGRGPAATDANAFANKAFVGSDLARFGSPLFTNDGVAAFHFDGSNYPRTGFTAAAANTWMQLDVTYNGTTLSCSKNGGAAQTVALSVAQQGGLFLLAHQFGTYLECDIAECITAKTALSAETLAGIKSYRNTRYGLAL